MPAIGPESVVALFGLDMLRRVLGPSASYLGDEVASWVKQRHTNLKQIFESADRKLVGRGDVQGSVPPRVLKRILDDGSYCDDPLMAEYFGGVLASSKSGISRDDRGAVHLATIEHLSTYQIRAHYIIYSIVKELFNGTGAMVDKDSQRSRLKIYISWPTWRAALGITTSEEERLKEITEHIMFGLEKEALIGKKIVYGSKKHLVKHFSGAPDDGILVGVSVWGIQLFMWANGRSDLKFSQYLDSAFDFHPTDLMTIPEGYCATHPQAIG